MKGLGVCRSHISLINKVKTGSNPREVENFLAELHNANAGVAQTHGTNSVNHSSMKIEVNDLESSIDKIKQN